MLSVREALAMASQKRIALPERKAARGWWSLVARNQRSADRVEQTSARVGSNPRTLTKRMPGPCS